MNQEPTLEQLRFPIGLFSHDGEITSSTINRWIEEIASLPDELKQAVDGLNEKQWNTPYRPDGWTIKQVVHHIADSHMNSVIRFKWALTEDRPTVKTYYEDRWALLGDYKEIDVQDSIAFIRLLHKRWVVLLRSLTDDDLQREFVHPESGATPLNKNIGIYAWHGKHHVAHITSLHQRMNW